MRLATWNINGLRARLDFLLPWLEERAPDLVGLQELKLADEQFPHEAIARAGYRAVVHGQKSWNGVAILAREEPRVLQVGLPGQEALGARLLAAEAGGIAFCTVYVPNGRTVDNDEFPRKLAWLDALAELLETRHTPEGPLVVCGDFNVCPAPLDSWNEEAFRGQIFHTEAERERVRRLLDWGLVDVFRAQHPDVQAFSWWDYRGGAFHRKQGLRIDFLLAAPAVAARAKAITIDREFRKKRDGLTPSDHAPVVLDLA